jgi:hypothetical protein
MGDVFLPTSHRSAETLPALYPPLSRFDATPWIVPIP